MGNKQELAAGLFAPRARITIPQLNEIDGPVVFCTPLKRLYFSNCSINLHEGAGAQERIKRQIVETNISVQPVLEVKVLDQGDRHLSPDFHHSRY